VNTERQTAAGRYSRTRFHHLFSRKSMPVSEIRKRSRMLKNVPHPMAANLLQNRHVDISAADIAMAKPNDQMNSATVSAKKIRFVEDFVFV
jgi:hypothetical protein